MEAHAISDILHAGEVDCWLCCNIVSCCTSLLSNEGLARAILQLRTDVVQLCTYLVATLLILDSASKVLYYRATCTSTLGNSTTVLVKVG
jgi:hypothetical protein